MTQDNIKTDSPRVAAVLAGSEGIGFACAIQLAKTGYRTVICSRSEEKLEAARASAAEQGLELASFAADLGSPDALEAFFKHVETNYGPVDVLINNNGGPPPGRLSTLEIDAWEEVFRSHSLPVISAIRRVLPSMKERGFGRIITIGSISVKAPIENLDLSNYTRGGLATLHRTLAREVASSGVTVHMVLPGSILTDRSRKRIQARSETNQTSFDHEIGQSAARIPMGRLGAPEDVANLVGFFSSPAASYITGTFVQVDGGLHTGLL
jgi:3-oxoacyl-[acyl-carrier protein] reductase